MKIYLYNIFSAFVYTFGTEINDDKREFNKEVDFVFKQFLNMSWYFVLAFGVLVIIFTFLLSRKGIPFHRLDEIDRLVKIKKLRTKEIGLIKDFVKFFNSLTTFAYYSYEQNNQK